MSGSTAEISRDEEPASGPPAPVAARRTGRGAGVGIEFERQLGTRCHPGLSCRSLWGGGPPVKRLPCPGLVPANFPHFHHSPFTSPWLLCISLRAEALQTGVGAAGGGVEAVSSAGNLAAGSCLQARSLVLAVPNRVRLAGTGALRASGAANSSSPYLAASASSRMAACTRMMARCLRPGGIQQGTGG